MSYVVLARKWRPQHFDEVVGQGHVARTLINSIEQDRVHHAYLFCGTRGVGKTTTARILAKALNCKEGPTGRPCYKCDSCLEISKGQSVDVFEIDGASNRGINEIRELRDGVRYAPSRDRNKIYIIDEVHMLTTEAFNALLKTLEEPPPHARFIFATTEPQKIPITILSRCQRFDFKRIGLQDIVWHLQNLCKAEEIDAEKAALQLVARQANGGMRDALSLLDQIISFAGMTIREEQVAEILGVANRKHLFDLSAAVIEHDAEKALLVLDDVDRYGYDLQQFVSELVTHFRDLMVTATVRQPERVTQLTESELEIAKAQVQGITKELLHRYFSVVVEAAQKMHRSPFPKLVFEMTLVRLAELEPLTNLDLLVDRLSMLESTLDDEEGPVHWPGGTGSSGGGQASQEVVKRDVPTLPEPRKAESRVPESPQPSKPEEEKKNFSSASISDSPKLAEVETEAPPTFADSKDEAPALAKSTLESRGVPALAEENEQEDHALETKESEEEVLPEEVREETVEKTGDNEEVSAALKRDASADQADLAVIDEVEEALEAKAEEVQPIIPQPLRPEEEIPLPNMSGLSTREDRWRVFVEYLRKKNAPVAAACEYAYVERFEDGEVILRFDDEGMKGIAGESGRREVIADTISELFGERWSVTCELRGHESEGLAKTLAQERQEDLLRRRQELEKELLENPAVVAAQELFGAKDPRVQVRLYDEW